MGKGMLVLSILLLVCSILVYFSINGMLVLSIMSPDILILTIAIISFLFIIANWRSSSSKTASS